MSYPELEIPAADLALPADLLSHVSDLLECMDPHAMDSEAALYREECKVLINLVLTQLNRWSPKEER
jgi:hypothetical protein